MSKDESQLNSVSAPDRGENKPGRRSEFADGLRSGIPIACGYFFVSFTFGILGASLGFRWWETVLISMTNLTSAGQIAGVKTIAAGGSAFELALSQFIINLRYSLMGISLAQNVSEDVSGPRRMFLGFGITDEIYGVAAARRMPVTSAFFLGLMTLAIYGMFIAIVVPEAKASKNVLGVVAIAAAVSCLMYYTPVLKEVSVGFAIIVSAVIAAAIGAWLFPPKEDGGACRE